MTSWAWVALSVGIVGLLILLDRARYARWRLKRSKRVTIREAAPGQIVKLVGEVRASETVLRSPVSDAACVCYSLVLGDAGEGALLVDEVEGASFWLNDGSDTIRVDPLRFVIVPAPGSEVTYSKSRVIEALEALRRYLERAAARGRYQGALLGIDSHGISFVRESSIKVGAKVAVQGLVETRVEEGEERLRITCPDDGALVISDDPATFG